jgi:hypothetical protein
VFLGDGGGDLWAMSAYSSHRSHFSTSSSTVTTLPPWSWHSKSVFLPLTVSSASSVSSYTCVDLRVPASRPRRPCSEAPHQRGRGGAGKCIHRARYSMTVGLGRRPVTDSASHAGP